MKKALKEALEARGYDTLTPVQQAVTAEELQGRDLLVSAQTGSGKTIGFGLAIAPTLLGEAETFPAAAAPLALIIAPTRELALQVKRELGWLYGPAGAVMASCVGGMDMRDERRTLARGAHVVVATPGRLRDHIMRGSIDLTAIRAVVLDEADEMLDLGFREDLEFILGEAPEARQTLLFSATVPAAIARLAQSYQKDAERIATTTGETQHADIDYRALKVSARDGENAIINVLRFHEAPNAIVFCNTRAMVNRLTTRLSNRGFSVVALSGELSQSERTHALQAMRDGRARVCVATDVAARGIDLPNLDLVIHAELPTNHETLLHRSGRTGRAGRKGVSAMIVPPASMKKAHRLLGWAKLNASWEAAPSADDVIDRDRERMLEDATWSEEIGEAERDSVDQLVARFTAEQIAAAYLRLHAERHSAPEDLSPVEAKPAPREAFGPSVWFAIDGGRDRDVEPRRMLPTLCKAADLTRDDIGAIRIQPTETYVEIKASSADAFVKALGPDMKLGGNTPVRRADGPPAGGRPSFDKPRAAAPKKAPAPKEAPRQDAPRPAAKGTTRPVDWNDDPAPRPKKPKPGAKPQARGKAKFGAAPGDGATKPWEKPRGPKPPSGKPSSKKNKARGTAPRPGSPKGNPNRAKP